MSIIIITDQMLMAITVTEVHSVFWVWAIIMGSLTMSKPITSCLMLEQQKHAVMPA